LCYAEIEARAPAGRFLRHRPPRAAVFPAAIRKRQVAPRRRSTWHEAIGDPTYADAILDRLVHNAHRIDLAGDSLRRTRPTPAAKD
jgi:hypothetical protein